jgi:alkylated DNA nucleotide flippase Atl1
MVESGLRSKIYNLIPQVTEDKITTYGDLAALAVYTNALIDIGVIAYYGDTVLSWHRLVNRLGGLAFRFPDGIDVQSQLLEQDNIDCKNYKIDNFEAIRWLLNL